MDVAELGFVKSSGFLPHKSLLVSVGNINMESKDSVRKTTVKAQSTFFPFRIAFRRADS